MGKKDLEKLRSASQSKKRPKAKPLIDAGETTWLMGLPAPAEDGMVAITMGEHQKTTIREDDIIDVEKSGEYFLVKVSSGADILYEFKAVVKATAPKLDCCGDDSQPDERVPTSASISLGSFGGFAGTDGGGGRMDWCATQCYVEMRCFQFWDKLGYARRICVPKIVCYDPCSGKRV